jgi:hypothetical protein
MSFGGCVEMLTLVLELRVGNSNPRFDAVEDDGTADGKIGIMAGSLPMLYISRIHGRIHFFFWL